MVTEVVNSTDVNFPKRKQAAFSHVQPLKKDDLGDMHNVPSEIHNSIQGQGVTSNKHRQLMKPWKNSKHPFYMFKFHRRFCRENRKITVKLKKKIAATHKCVRHKIKLLK